MGIISSLSDDRLRPARPAAAEAITKASPHSVSETVQRLLDVLEARQVKVFAAIDQREEARAVGLELCETPLAAIDALTDAAIGGPA